MIFKHGGTGLLHIHRLLHVCSLITYSQIFPNHSAAKRPICKNSALARIRERHSELRAIANTHVDNA